MIVLDANVVSELMRDQPAEAVLEWMDQQVADDLFLTAVTVAELLYGVARLPDGRRKQVLGGQIEEMIVEDFDDRVIAFDEDAAAHYADIAAARERAGHPISTADAQIAATCRSHDASLATRNVDDFSSTGIELINPWAAR